MDVKLDDGRLSICGDIWNRLRTCVLHGGQCNEEIVRAFPGSKKVRRLVEIWQRWHLNDMRAGCAHQRAAGWSSEDCGKPCSWCGYRYGTAWLREEIPADVVAEIMTWGDPWTPTVS